MTQFNADLSSPVATEPSACIRSACLADVPQLTHLLTSSFYSSSGWGRWVYPLVKLGIQEDLKQRLNSTRSHYACLTALQPAPAGTGERIAGTIEVSKRQSWPWQGLNPQYAYLSNLAVGHNFRRRGVAVALIKSCEHLVRRWQIDTIYLHVMEDNVEARKLYHKAGFHLFQAEETPTTWLGLQPRRLLMHKPLIQP